MHACIVCTHGHAVGTHPPAHAASPLQLEVVNGELWGNVWQTECIARVNMTTGVVIGWIHMHGLRDTLLKRGLAANHRMDVLNGASWCSTRWAVAGRSGVLCAGGRG